MERIDDALKISKEAQKSHKQAKLIRCPINKELTREANERIKKWQGKQSKVISKANDYYAREVKQ